MLKGRFLGMAKNVCDKFCYLILKIPDSDTEMSQVLAQSVIRPRCRTERAPIVFTRVDNETYEFYKHDGKTPLRTQEKEQIENDGNPIE